MRSLNIRRQSWHPNVRYPSDVRRLRPPILDEVQCGQVTGVLPRSGENVTLTGDRCLRSDGTVDRGALLAIDIENAADMLHDFTMERSEVVYGYRIVGEGAHPHEAAGPHVALGGGQRGELRMRFDEPGTYLFYCNVTGHRRGGMTGTITVR